MAKGFHGVRVDKQIITEGEKMNQGSGTLFPYLELGSGFIFGFSIGMVLKKSFKVLIILLGAGLIFMLVLEHNGLVQINETNTGNAIAWGTQEFKKGVSFLEGSVEQYKGVGSIGAVGGFIAGVKYG